MSFVDTDLVIQVRIGLRLQAILDRDRPDGLLKAEEEAVLSLRCRDSVIATGGSVVMSPRAMEHIKSCGTVVYVNTPANELAGI